jgi:immune inhibitor A
MNRKWIISLLVLLVVLVVMALAGLSALVYVASSPQTPTATVRVNTPRPTVIVEDRRTPVFVPTALPPTKTSSPATVAPPTSAATRTIAATPPLVVAPLIDTATALQQTIIPSRDLFQIVPRLKKNLNLLTPVPTLAPKVRQVGQRENFFVSEDMATGSYRTAVATLQVVSEHALMWVEDGINFDAAALKRSAETFDTKIFPNNAKYFGAPKAGLDGDARIHILTTRFKDAAGYFSSVDMHPTAFSQYSNQRNIIFMNFDASKPGADEYNADLSHEFQHLIHFYQANNKAGWIDEGMSELAMRVNSYQVGGVVDLFGRTFNTQLNTWGAGQDSLTHYGASYVFFAYIADRFGPDAIRDVMLAPREGVNAIQVMLDKRAPGTKVEDFFADWAIANFVNDASVADGRYVHKTEPGFRISREPIISAYPDSRTAKQREYATTYYTLQPANGDVTIVFTGTTTAKLIDANAHSGKWVWYSNRADLSDMTLTREVDLTRVSGKATLRFWTWYDIEQDYDYGYTEVSTDGGKTWDILSGKFTTTTNPGGSNYKAGLTGKSGDWAQEEMDLSPYAGKRVLLRFEYITDDAYNAPGWAIDDITIPEINFNDNIESGAGDWDAKGFLRSDNVLPQKYIVQVIEKSGTTNIKRITLDAQNRGSYTIAGFGKGVTSATLVVTAFAPTTTEVHEYQLGIVPK